MIQNMYSKYHTHDVKERQWHLLHSITVDFSIVVPFVRFATMSLILVHF